MTGAKKTAEGGEGREEGFTRTHAHTGKNGVSFKASQSIVVLVCRNTFDTES